MHAAVIERAVALNGRAVFLVLNAVNIGVEIYVALIVVAARVDNRIGMDEIILGFAGQPEAELLGLRAGALDQIAAVQDDIRVIVLDRLVQLGTGGEDIANPTAKSD